MKYQPARVQLGQGQNGGLVAWLWSQARRVGQALCRAFCRARDSRILAAMYSLSGSRGVVMWGSPEMGRGLPDSVPVGLFERLKIDGGGPAVLPYPLKDGLKIGVLSRH